MLQKRKSASRRNANGWRIGSWRTTKSQKNLINQTIKNQIKFSFKRNRIMALRTIVTLPEPVLYRKARTIKRFDENLQSLIDDMIDTMRDAPGVGLAAPQVGISERLIVVEHAEEPEEESEDEE